MLLYSCNAMQWLGDVEYAYAYACEQSIEAGAIILIVVELGVFREIYDGGKADLGII